VASRSPLEGGYKKIVPSTVIPVKTGIQNFFGKTVPGCRIRSGMTADGSRYSHLFGARIYMNIFIKAFLTGSVEPIRVLHRRWRAYIDTKSCV